MKERKFYNPWTQKVAEEVRIERNDIEQALSWFDRLPSSKITQNDRRVYDDLRTAVSHMQSLDIN